MPYNPKRRFQLHLRALSIRYNTSASFLSIGNVGITFFEDSETISFRDNRCAHINLSIPYTEPAHLLKQYYRFTAVVKKILNSKTYN